MSTTKRQEQILELLRENRSLTVTKLSELTYTSASSIRRDLTRLENMYLLKRTHGGATIVSESGEAPNFANRMGENIMGKKRIAKKASALIEDGMSVMLDGSSTAAYLVPHLAAHKGITLFTNNMLTAISAINYGIKTHCIGGESLHGSAVLSGTAAYNAINDIHPDILFFSSRAIDRDGVISDPTAEENYLRSLMLRNAALKVFLCDSEKFGKRALHRLTTIGEMDAAVFDKPYDELDTSCRIL